MAQYQRLQDEIAGGKRSIAPGIGALSARASRHLHGASKPMQIQLIGPDHRHTLAHLLLDDFEVGDVLGADQ